MFVESLDEVPYGARLLLSAHGVSPVVKADAAALGLRVVDTACPLVTKVHAEARRFAEAGRQVIVIGHRGHVEVEGTIGALGQRPHHLIETVEEARALPIDRSAGYAYVTQTTLSIDDTAEVIATLRRRIPDLEAPSRADICYATTSRQAAVKAIAAKVDCLVVVGGPKQLQQ